MHKFLHKISTEMHKAKVDDKIYNSVKRVDTKNIQNNNILKNIQKQNPVNVSKTDNATKIDKSSTLVEHQQKREMDFVKNRLSQVISLYSKGLTQSEIIHVIPEIPTPIFFKRDTVTKD